MILLLYQLSYAAEGEAVPSGTANGDVRGAIPGLSRGGAARPT